MKHILIIVILFWCGCIGISKNTNNGGKNNSVFAMKPPKKVVTHVTLTCYQPVASQCNTDCLHTADNSFIDLKKLKSGRLKWVAISQDLLYMIPMGSKVKITDESTGTCYGTYIVKDKMNKRWSHRMDILVHPNVTPEIYGENIKVEVV